MTALTNGDMRHFNRYAYAYHNPYKFTDPDGRCGTCDRNNDQYARDAAAGNTAVYAPFVKPAAAVAVAALPLAPAARGVVGLVRTVRSLLNRQPDVVAGTAKGSMEGKPNSIYVQTTKDGRAVQSTVYNKDGRAVGHVDWKGSHGHKFEPGKPNTGHGPGKEHIPLEKLPDSWRKLPENIEPIR